MFVQRSQVGLHISRQDSKRSTYIPAPHTAVALARLLDLKFSEVWSVLEGPGSMLLGML
jgi:hypothetical protein